MECGECGKIGQIVPRPVVAERKRGQESVTVLHQPMVVETVRVFLLRHENVKKINVS